MDTRKSVLGPISAMAPAAAAVTEARVGVTNCPARFWTGPYWRLLVSAYPSSTYPTAPGVCATVAATPSLPRPPSPTGQLTDVPLPTRRCHSGLTLEIGRAAGR